MWYCYHEPATSGKPAALQSNQVNRRLPFFLDDNATAPPLVLMRYFRLDDITKRAGTVLGAAGRARCTIPQFGPLGGPASRPERANFEDRVRSRKCGSRKDHYSPE